MSVPVSNNMEGAFDDIEVIAKPDENNSSRSLIIVQNKNKNKYIVAHVRVDGSENVKLSRIDNTKFDLFPHEFEARIGPGASVLVGPNTFRYMNSHNLSPSFVDRTEIAVTYEAQGAVYVEDEHDTLPDSGLVKDYLCFYEVQVPSKVPGEQPISLLYSVNLNHVYGIQAFVESNNTQNEWWDVSLSVFETKLNHSHETDPIRNWQVKRPKFFKVYPPRIL